MESRGASGKMQSLNGRVHVNLAFFLKMHSCKPVTMSRGTSGAEILYSEKGKGSILHKPLWAANAAVTLDFH